MKKIAHGYVILGGGGSNWLETKEAKCKYMFMFCYGLRLIQLHRQREWTLFVHKYAQ